MNLPKLQALAAPLTAPVPSAISISAEAYQYILSTGIHISFAWVAAIGAFVGIETVGGASCYAAVKLHRQKNYGIEFWVSLVGIAIYIYSGWLTLYNSPTIIFFFLAPFAYFAYSILRSMEQEIGEKESEIEAQIKLIEAKKRLANAEARKIKSTNSTKHFVESTNVDVESTNSKSYICPYCDVDQRSARRYSVHVGRYCKEKSE